MNDEANSTGSVQADSAPSGGSTGPRLESINLTKRYEDGTLGLNNVSFKVDAGSIYAMLGGNGAGKTTAINLFLNFIEPTSGEARVDGIVTHKEPLKAKERLAYVSENVMLYPNFTAIQNLDFFAKLGGKTNCSKDDYRDVLCRVGLEEAAHARRLKGYSKGMRQKCGIAIAILKDAPAILLDEPTAGLDPSAGLEFIRLLTDLRSEGKAILMSTHDIFRAKDVADTIGIMNEGVLIMERTSEELRGENLEQLYVQYMAGYVGSDQSVETIAR
jgi:ABC-2 type transport system ATP-binding protein